MANTQAERRLKNIGKALDCIMLTGKEYPSHSKSTVTGMKERKLLLLMPEKTLEKRQSLGGHALPQALENIGGIS